VGKVLHIESRAIKDDLLEVIDFKVNTLAQKNRYPPALRQEVKSKLQGGSGGTFLWASLMVEVLERSSTAVARKLLNQMPKNLSALYTQILIRLDSTEKDLATFVLRTLTVAQQSMKPIELAASYAMSDYSGHDWGSEAECPEVLEKISEYLDIYTVCLPLVQYDKHTNGVSFIHQSVKDYLLDPAGMREAELFDYHVVYEDADYDVFKSCWRQLIFLSHLQPDYQQGGRTISDLNSPSGGSVASRSASEASASAMRHLDLFLNDDQQIYEPDSELHGAPNDTLSDDAALDVAWIDETALDETALDETALDETARDEAARDHLIQIIYPAKNLRSSTRIPSYPGSWQSFQV